LETVVLTYGLPVLFVLFLWWFSTGLVLYVIGLPLSTRRRNMTVMTGLAALALAALYATGDVMTVPAAYTAFTAAIVVWGWHEMSFLTGLVTGPRNDACPGRDGEPGCESAPLGPAVESVIYHEAAIALTAALIWAMTWDSANQVGLWTFVILWLMRLSAKLNVYLGVRNLTESFLPPHLEYLKTYFCRKPMNGFFPVAVTVSTVVAVALVMAAADATTAFTATSLTFLATLMALAVIEHWFLVIPLPAERLFSWGLTSRTPQAPDMAAKDDAIRMAAA
jgi:putative photosynthetic complex assembly protein 2